MKKAISVFAFGLFAAAAAMAGGGGSQGGGGGGGTTPPPTTTACVTCPEINVDAPLVQITSTVNSTVSNKGDSGATARQNLASNTGNVTIKAATVQAVLSDSSSIENAATGSASSMATQNIATNIGKVNVNGALVQVASFASSSVLNKAKGGATVTQNIASNNGCSVCNK